MQIFPVLAEKVNELVGVVIVNFQNYWDTIDFVSNQLFKQKDIKLKIAIVDNASPNDSFDVLAREFEGINNVEVLQSKENRGYSSGNNIGIRYLLKSRECSYIIIANNDISFSDPALIRKLVQKYHKLSHVALWAPMMSNKNVICKNSAWRLPSVMSEVLSSTFCLTSLFRRYLNKYYYDLSERSNLELPVDCLAGSFFMGTTETFEKIGYFDEGIFLYYEEMILGHKVKRLHLINYLVKDLAYNHKGASSINLSYNLSNKYSIRNSSKLYYWRKYRRKGFLFLVMIRILNYFNILEIRALGLFRALFK
ncbi:MAG: glycosyltransferase family 2 protein [Candidatus Latescibacteria bacterium]|jgi:GT2 family glycosyltransferase|nr:glycosyltransferase family 2 protein [Candidatus Latescibacterota bacterium]